MAPYRYRTIFGEDRLILPNLLVYGNYCKFLNEMYFQLKCLFNNEILLKFDNFISKRIKM